MAINTGSQALDFTLYNTTKEAVTLSNFKGKNVLILFFPFAFTSVCTEELCEIRDNLSIYENLNVEVLAISVDSPFTLAKFKEIMNYNFTMLSDFNKEVSTLYECIYETFALGCKGVSKRSAFVVDKEGIVQYAEVLEKASDVPNFTAIKDCLQKLN